MTQKPIPANQGVPTAASNRAVSFYTAGSGVYGKPRPFNLRDLLIVFFKHKYMIISIFCLAVILTPLVYYFLPAKYEASSTLMFRYGQEYQSPMVSGEQTPVRVGLQEILHSELAILSSTDLKERLLKSLGIESIYPKLRAFSDEPVKQLEYAKVFFERDLHVQAGRNSNLITVTFQNADPGTAAKVVNSLVAAYIARRVEILHDSRPLQLLDKKVAEYLERLKRSEGELQAFKQQHQVFAFDEQRDLLLKERMNLETTARTTQSLVKELRQKLSTLESQLKGVAASLPVASENDPRNELEMQLVTLQRKEQELLSKYKEGNVFVTSVRSEIQVVKGFIEKQKQAAARGRSAVNSLYQDLQKEIISTKAEVSSLEVRSKELEAQLTLADKRIQEFDQQERTARDLQRTLTANEQMYQLYQKRFEEARVSEDMSQDKMASVNVIEQASASELPIWPTKGVSFYLVLAAFLGIGGGLTLAFSLEFINQGLSSPQKTEQCLNIPVLTTIPYKA